MNMNIHYRLSFGSESFSKFLQFTLQLKDNMTYVNGNYHYICQIFLLPFHGISRSHNSAWYLIDPNYYVLMN